ncbi:efflux RND transporter permease subunit [Desulfocicer niacini]
MKDAVKGLNNYFERLPEMLRQRKIFVLGVLLAITVLLGGGLGGIVMDNSLDSFFKNDDPVKKEYDSFKAVFGGDEYIYIVYRARDGDIFSKKSIQALKGLYDDISQYRLGLPALEKSPLDHIVEIKSLINIKFLEASKDTLYSRSLIGDNLPKNKHEREILREKALNHPDYPHLFLSKDSRYGGMLLRTDFNSEVVTLDDGVAGSAETFDDEDEFDETWEDSVFSGASADLVFKKTDMSEYPLLLSALRSLMSKKEYRDALDFHPVGKPVMMDFFAKVVFEDMGKIMGLVLLIIVAMLWLLFRSFCAVVWPVVLIVTTVVWVMGIIGWSKVPMSIMFQIIIFMILSVGVADAVHILSGYLFFRQGNFDHENALKAVMKKSGLACFLTSTTTAVGLLSLSLVPIKPIAVFGIFTALGVLTAFFLTLVLMPLMLDLWHPAPRVGVKKQHFIQRMIQKLENTGLVAPGKVIMVFTGLGIFFFMGLMTLRIDSDEVEVLKKGLPLRASFDVVNTHMGGTGNMEISIDLKKPDALKEPAILYKIQALQDYLRDVEGSKVVKTISLVNVVKDSYKALNNGDEHFYMIPEDPGVLAQTLFLFDNANPRDRRRLVSDDYSNARIGIHSKNAGSVESLLFKEKVQHYIDDNFKEIRAKYPDSEITLTGNMILLAKMLDYISWSQIKSFGLTLVVISVILFMVLGNVKAGIMAIVPNVFPILATFGIMGFLGIPLDMDTLLIAPVIIGLAVDDTIHFLTHYRLEVDKYGDIKKAAVNSIREAGQAICFTSLILAAGFSMFFLSFHKGLSHFGIFSAIAIITAFIADIYLLPALCAFFKVDFKPGPFKKRYLFWGKYSKKNSISPENYKNRAKKRQLPLKNSIISLAVMSILPMSMCFAQDARSIMEKVDNRDDGTTLIARVRLTSYRYVKKGGKYVPAEKPRVKLMDFVRKDYGPREKDHKSVSTVIQPKSERGISFLQYDYEKVGRDTDQWMYLSAIGKVKRIVSGNDNEPKTGSFFGTEFNYEDMESYNIDDYTYKILGSELYGKNQCWVIEAIPVMRKSVKSNYSREILWIDKKRDFILKSVLFNRNGKKAKKILYGNIKIIDGILVPMTIIVNNVETGRRTIMVYEKIILNRAVDDDYLTQRSLTDKGFREQKLKEYQESGR